MTKILGCSRGPNDGRDWASGIWSAEVANQKDAIAIARDVQQHGQRSLDEAVASGKAVVTVMHNGHRAASGHGVVIVYASGRRRMID